VAAFWLTRLLETSLFEITPHDPATFVAVAAVLTGIALAAVGFPARRATRVDPIEALRVE
jgi:ABC-type lipoprotein release transport system permease subunit